MSISLASLSIRKPSNSRSAAEAGYGSMQGAREYQEDRATIASTRWFGVHDGHGGSEAVDKLVAWLAERGCDADDDDGKSDMEKGWDMRQDEHVQSMARVYYDALEALKREASGVVSISAMCRPDAIYLGWVGDCEGCVFCGEPDDYYNNKLSPQQQLIVCGGVNQLDFADCTFQEKLKQAATNPHCFASRPLCMLEDLENEKTTRKFLKVEKYVTRENLLVQRFPPEDGRSQEELRKVQRAHPEARVRLDNTMLQIGDVSLLVDARLSGSIQPTRALGDCRERMALRHPTVMRVTRRQDTVYHVLLCSDGAFSRGAFADMQGLCQCVTAPLEYITKRGLLYRKGQEITERLIAAGLYEGLAKELQGVNTWQSVIAFLRHKHLAAVRSEKFFATFQDYYYHHHSSKPGDDGDTNNNNTSSNKEENDDDAAAVVAWWWNRYNAGHTEWLRACQKSVQQLEGHVAPLLENGETAELLLTCELAAQITANLAVIMGSTDNVTVLVARHV